MRNIMRKTLLTCVGAAVFATSLGYSLQMRSIKSANADTGFCQPTCALCAPRISECSQEGIAESKKQENYTDKPYAQGGFTENEFVIHREWMVKVFFEAHILPALMLFAEQISAMAMHQVSVIGSFLDAKHQLETQRLFQQMMAQAHKDYHPSEGMCVFGTNMRSLAASDRNMDLSAAVFSARGLQRELLAKDAVSSQSGSTDTLSRLHQFREIYCNPKDNGIGMELFCPNPKHSARMNKDIDYTTTFDAPLTLKVDFTEEGNPDHSANKHVQTLSADEEDVLALSANLYAHSLPPFIPLSLLSRKKGEINTEGMTHYMNIRAIAAKRSVARNSYAAIMALKSQGEKEVQPYLFALVKEMGITDENELKKYLGERPSYYAQMEVLTKKLYQNPNFYTELYDKPANVERKNVSMKAIELMQKRDIYRSILRSEAILSVMLETALADEQSRVDNEINTLPDQGKLINLD
jgi:hypothetical protein